MNRERSYRIGFDITAAVCQGAGIGRYSRELVYALLKHESQFHYRLISARPTIDLHPSDPILSAENASYRSLRLSDRWLYRIWHRLRLPLRADWLTGQIDLFHSPDFVLPPLGWRMPAVLTVHDLSFLHYPETFTPSLLKFLNQAVPRSIKRATHILADSEATRADLIDAWPVVAEKVSVIYSGVSPLFKPVADSSLIQLTREKFRLGKEPYILSVGTLQPRKNYEMLFRAFHDVAKNLSIKLIIVGGLGWMYDHIQAEIEALGLSGKVLLLGYVADSELPALYSGARLFVFPSLYEGFGLPVVEAMACGVPVLSSNASSLPEVAGTAALMLSPDDQEGWAREMIKILEDPEKRTKMIAAGFLQARNFRWKKSAQAVVEIYMRLVEG